MKRWMGWMLVGSLAAGGAAVAQDDSKKQQDSQEQQQNGVDDSQGMFRMGGAEAIDQGESVKDTTGTGGSGVQVQGARADAQGMKMMQQGMLPIPTDENAFLNELHHANQMEVQLGQLAQQKGVARGVKDFGARMVKDHQQASQRLMTYAQKKNLQLGEPKVENDFQRMMKQAEDATMAKLQSLEGPAFDREYLAHMVADHDADIAKVMAGQQQFAGNTELKRELDTLLPTLQQHRQQAHRLLGQETPRQARRPQTPQTR